MIDLFQLGLRISTRRRELNLTQQNLADSLNISPQAVSKWERGLTFPNPAFLDELASALCVSLDELLTGCKG